jgi:hypothetical protein
VAGGATRAREPPGECEVPVNPNRAVSVGVMALAIGLVSCMSSAANAAPKPSPTFLDTVVATGTSDTAYSNIDITAHSGTSGENPSGQASFLLFNSSVLSGPVTCLSVTGPDVGGGTLASPTVATLNVQTSLLGIVTVVLIDNGGNGADIMNTGPTGRQPSDCSPFVGSLPGVLVQGRAVVFDAPLPPTSKAQCKKGGWSKFGFKNQGQCIKLVNHV